MGRRIKKKDEDEPPKNWKGPGPNPALQMVKNISEIKNKAKRQEIYFKLKKEKNKAKREARLKRVKELKALGENAPPKQIPRTLENTREYDETVVEAGDEEVELDDQTDEFASYFNKEYVPKILLTTVDKPRGKTIKFCRELELVLPNAEFKYRNYAHLKKTIPKAIERGFTDFLVVNEHRGAPSGLLVIHLPEGPTAYYKISSVKPMTDIKHAAQFTSHRPEVLLNNFGTRLGHSVSRMLACLFHYNPEFHGRRVVTFHNQRDFIFFRHHRYEFDSDGQKCRLQEIGPRFTLKLQSLQKGTFDSKYGEYEWILKRHEMETSRRRFFL
ncbi:ribosome production factor 1 [Galendromus occidentalis]|uniref:Ribosome production factor 1 n=1 Tax=Galendromus occidentalis TaxID=34638 RepID=A0AAJ6QW40_9ACAR|nr:ribosome production factor 1 [Galendromus occidentalis]